MADVSLQASELAQARRLATEYAVSRLLSEGDEPQATLRRALAVMGQKLGFEYCVCWRRVESSGGMRVAAVWQRHPHQTEELARHAHGIEIRPGHGFAGRAWLAGSPIWIQNVAHDPDFLSAAEARAAGLAAGVCCPIHARGDIIGLLQLIAAEGAEPDSDSIPVLVSLASQIGQFLDREAIAAELSASEARYRTLFDANIAAVHLATNAGETMAVNPAFVRLLGFDSADAAMRFDARELYLDPAERLRLMEQLRRHGRDVNRQLELRRHDGSVIWVLANTVLIRGRDGAPDLNESTLIDITETKEMERRFWQTSKLEGIGRLAGGIAHDFNNLLTIINGYSDMLLSKLSETDPARGGIQKIRQAGRRAEGLTQQLMAFSRHQAGQPRALDLAQSVGECEELLRGNLPENIELHCFAPAERAMIVADPGQVSQVLMNLALNARDAMPGGGELYFEMVNVEVDETYTKRHIQSRQGRFVRLAVRDTGTGMDPETRSHVFEPFFTTKPDGKGHGLGLATAYGLVLQNGGWIELDTELGHGTTFEIYWPRADRAALAAAEAAPAAPAPAAPGPAMDPRQVSILVAEDEAQVRELIEGVLLDGGYHVVGTAADGARALALASSSEQKLDLLITDVIMPGLTGPELAEWLWLRRPSARVLFISGYTEHAVREQGLLPARAGAFAYLQKPFGPQSLQLAIAELLRVRTGEEAK